MTVRTTKSTVTFECPFVLGDFNEIFPPGSYDVETDEELLEGLSFPAYRESQALIHLPVTTGRPGVTRTLAIGPGELDAALERDKASGARSRLQTAIRGMARTSGRNDAGGVGEAAGGG